MVREYPPYNFPYAGYVLDGHLIGYEYARAPNPDSPEGYYWSRTASSSNNAYRLVFNSSNVYPANGSANRYYGFSVRCVATT